MTRKQVQQNILTKLILWIQLRVYNVYSLKVKIYFLYLLIAALIQAGKLDWMGACREQFKYTKYVKQF